MTLKGEGKGKWRDTGSDKTFGLLQAAVVVAVEPVAVLDRVGEPPTGESGEEGVQQL